MAKRVGIVVAGLGARDGSDILDTMTVALGLLRGGAEPVLLVPAGDSARVVDHATGELMAGEAVRSAAHEVARLGLGVPQILDGHEAPTLSALFIPGGAGVSYVLSNYAEKGAVCDVHPALALLLRETFKARRPLAFAGSSALLAARVLGPVAGVRITLGHRGTHADKLAAVMGADVRPCLAQDLMMDQKHLVLSTPSSLLPEASMRQRFQGLDRLTKTLLGLARSIGPESATDEAVSPPAGHGPAPGHSHSPAASPVRPSANTAHAEPRQGEPPRPRGDVLVRRRPNGQRPPGQTAKP
jgi:enhancing lycopene biosynthesis protein 2